MTFSKNIEKIKKELRSKKYNEDTCKINEIVSYFEDKTQTLLISRNQIYAIIIFIKHLKNTHKEKIFNLLINKQNNDLLNLFFKKYNSSSKLFAELFLYSTKNGWTHNYFLNKALECENVFAKNRANELSDFDKIAIKDKNILNDYYSIIKSENYYNKYYKKYFDKHLSKSYKKQENKKDIERIIQECIDTKNKKLYLSDKGISDLSKLKNLDKCTHITEIDLFKNSISDISPLINLPNLIIIILEKNKVKDFKPLYKMPNIEILSLENNNITDVDILIDYLKGRKEKLEVLDLSNNNIDTKDLFKINNLVLEFHYKGNNFDGNLDYDDFYE